jgi:hypothetical protein
MIYSYHNFIFPFRFDFIKEEIEDKHEYYKNNSFDERVKIDNDFYELLKKDNWEYKKFEVKTNYNYNEFVYFHDFVKDSLYNIAECFTENATSWLFNKKFENASFKFSVKETEYYPFKEYEFKINTISLRIFDTGIGILSFDFENKKYSNKDDILKINEFGRRIYPQFLDSDKSTSAVKGTFLADNVSIIIDDIKFEEDFNESNLTDVKIGNHITSLLGKNTFTQNKKDVNKYLIQQIIDDRMFVISWYGNDEFANKLKSYNYEKSDFWYEFVFVDGNGKTVKSDRMQKDLIKKATYDRWMDYGTLFGISRYSFVCLSKNQDYTRNVLPLPHIKTMYFQIFTIILALRATILRFSDEVTAISDIDENDEEIEERVRNLYKNYLRFKNKIYFREVTAQDQGIELYEKALEILKIEKEINDLEQEINSLHTYANMITEKKSNEKMNKLTEMGSIFLPATLIAGIFGMNSFTDKGIANWNEFFMAIKMMFLFTIVFIIWINKEKIKSFLLKFLNFLKKIILNIRI